MKMYEFFMMNQMLRDVLFHVRRLKFMLLDCFSDDFYDIHQNDDVYVHSTSIAVLDSVLSMESPRMVSPVLGINLPGYKLKRGEIRYGGLGKPHDLCPTCFTEFKVQYRDIIAESCNNYSGRWNAICPDKPLYTFRFFDSLRFSFFRINISLIDINRDLSEGYLVSEKHLMHEENRTRSIVCAYKSLIEFMPYMTPLICKVPYFGFDVFFSLEFWSELYKFVAENANEDDFTHSVKSLMQGDKARLVVLFEKVHTLVVRQQFYQQTCDDLYNSALGFEQLSNCAADASFIFCKSWDDEKMIKKIYEFSLSLNGFTNDLGHDCTYGKLKNDYRDYQHRSNIHIDYPKLVDDFVVPFVDVESAYGDYKEEQKVKLGELIPLKQLGLRADEAKIKGFAPDTMLKLGYDQSDLAKAGFFENELRNAAFFAGNGSESHDLDTISCLFSQCSSEDRHKKHIKLCMTISQLKKRKLIASKRLGTLRMLIDKNRVLMQPTRSKFTKKMHKILSVSRLHGYVCRPLLSISSRFWNPLRRCFLHFKRLDYPCHFLYIKRADIPKMYLICDFKREFRPKVPLRLDDFSMVIVPKAVKSYVRSRLIEKNINGLCVATMDELDIVSSCMFRSSNV